MVAGIESAYPVPKEISTKAFVKVEQPVLFSVVVIEIRKMKGPARAWRTRSFFILI